ncbi:MAG: DUF1330 domain-containing protein [Betaproteobacteria bacterium]|nr:DUF1330 domain-containing protein [Betaproteobacteria bacterium]
MPAIMVTVASFAPGGAEHYARYAAGVLPLLSKAQVKLRERLEGREALVGSDFPDLVAVMEFPDEATMRFFLSSKEYQALIPHREKAFSMLRTFSCVAL